MADVQVETGYTRIANELFEAVLRAPAPSGHKLVLFGIIRLTYGFNRSRDRLAIGYLAEHVGMDPRDVRRALADLERWGMITREGGGPGRGNIATIGVQKDFDRWAIGRSTDAARRERVRVAAAKTGERPPVIGEPKRGGVPPVSEREKRGANARKEGGAPLLQRQLPKTAQNTHSEGVCEGKRPEPEAAGPDWADDAARVIAATVARRWPRATPRDPAAEARALRRLETRLPPATIAAAVAWWAEPRHDGNRWLPTVQSAEDLEAKWDRLVDARERARPRASPGLGVAYREVPRAPLASVPLSEEQKAEALAHLAAVRAQHPRRLRS